MSAPTLDRRSTKSRKVRVFMDGVDWQWEIGSASDGTKTYPSVRCLKREVKHDLTECGIAEVEVRFVRWIKKPKI